MKNIIFILLPSLLSSCITQKACNNKFPPETIVKDSIIEKIVYRDTTIVVPGFAVHDTIKIDCDQNGKAYIVNPRPKGKTNGKANTSAEIVDNNLITQCECAEEKLTIQKLKEEKTRTEIHTETIIKPPIVIKEVPVWAWILIGFMVPFFTIGILRVAKVLFFR